MGKSVFLAATDPGAERPAATGAFLQYCSGTGAKPGFFKTILKDPDNCQRIKDLSGKLGVAPRDLYGLSLQEAVTFLNSGREASLIEEVLARYSVLAARFDCVLIEGADLQDVAAFALQGIDAKLAANLASPVVVLSSAGACLAASGARYYLGSHAEVVAVVLAGEAKVPEAKEIGILAGIDVLAVKPADYASLPAVIAKKLEGYVPRVVTPKRFEYDLIERARSPKQRIVLPEGDDERILQAADDILRR
ncbi:MAG: AAA family ATPase, partial [Deltaproteobacteria bacterium]|nr:AAA family ATPase [Deltaproteobacteria bacterium]